MRTLHGIDVSENNGDVDFRVIKMYNRDFAIIRLGYGQWNLDSKFYDNINNALNAGLLLGVYFYSYALNEADAAEEAEFVINTLEQAGLTPDRLPMGVWFDMEDADGYKEIHNMPTNQELTNICSVFINKLWNAGYAKTGLYASLDWLENVLYVDQLGGCPIWCAQWGGDECDYPANLWQYSSAERFENQEFDANATVDWDVDEELLNG